MTDSMVVREGGTRGALAGHGHERRLCRQVQTAALATAGGANDSDEDVECCAANKCSAQITAPCRTTSCHTGHPPRPIFPCPQYTSSVLPSTKTAPTYSPAYTAAHLLCVPATLRHARRTSLEAAEQLLTCLHSVTRSVQGGVIRERGVLAGQPRVPAILQRLIPALPAQTPVHGTAKCQLQ